MDEIISYKMCAVKVRNAKLRNYLKDVIQSTLDLHAPIKTIKIRSRSNTFVTPDTKELMKSRDKLHQ